MGLLLAHTKAFSHISLKIVLCLGGCVHRSSVYGLATRAWAGFNSSLLFNWVPICSIQPVQPYEGGLSVPPKSVRLVSRAHSGPLLGCLGIVSPHLQILGTTWPISSLPAGALAQKMWTQEQSKMLSHADSLSCPHGLLPHLVFETLSCPFPSAQLPDRKSD